MTEEDLRTAVALKENYIRIEKGRDNRSGHNWEAAVEWFVDKFTTGASFREQPHRSTGMDSRRITLHLIRSVGGRRMNVEVDRVWTVTPGLFSPPTTYVLECKWGVVRKQDLDEFLNVLRWSTDFGVDTPDGRQLKQGVTGIFAASAFNPKERARVSDQMMNLASYAGRLNMSLLKAADLEAQPWLWLQMDGGSSLLVSEANLRREWNCANDKIGDDSGQSSISSARMLADPRKL